MAGMFTRLSRRTVAYWQWLESHPQATDHPTEQPIVSRSDVVALVRSLTAGVSPDDTISAKLVVLGAVSAADGHLALLNSSSVVWAVQVRGIYTPGFAHGESYAWGILFVNSRTGDVVATTASNKGREVPYWASLPDQTS